MISLRCLFNLQQFRMVCAVDHSRKLEFYLYYRHCEIDGVEMQNNRVKAICFYYGRSLYYSFAVSFARFLTEDHNRPKWDMLERAHASSACMCGSPFRPLALLPHSRRLPQRPPAVHLYRTPARGSADPQTMADDDEFYVRYYCGHHGKFGHEYAPVPLGVHQGYRGIILFLESQMHILQHYICFRSPSTGLAVAAERSPRPLYMQRRKTTRSFQPSWPPPPNDALIVSQRVLIKRIFASINTTVLHI